MPEFSCDPALALVVGFFLGMAFMALFIVRRSMDARDMHYALTQIDWLCSREIERFKAPILHKIGRIAGQGLGRLPKKNVEE
jgi:hypothetical protein